MSSSTGSARSSSRSADQAAQLRPDEERSALDRQLVLAAKALRQQPVRNRALPCPPRAAVVTRTLSFVRRTPREHRPRRQPIGSPRAAPARESDPDEPAPPLGRLLAEAVRMTDCLSVAELCASANVSAKRMRAFLADFAAVGIAECVGPRSLAAHSCRGSSTTCRFFSSAPATSHSNPATTMA